MINLGQIGQITKTFKSSSAAVPSLILSAIFGPVSVVASLFASEPLSYVLVSLGTVALILPVLQIAYFTFSDPDRLQNEEHVENKLLIAQGKMIKGDSHSIIDIESVGQPVENPALEGKADV